MVDHADHEEQRRLEGGVRDEHDDAGLGRFASPRTEDHHEEAELAHRAAGEDALQVDLAQRLERTRDHRDEPDAPHDRSPGRLVDEDGCQPRDQVDARLHHRGRVQQGAHRGGRHHRTREPGGERELCRLGERADEREHHADRRCGAGRRMVDESRQVGGSGGVRDQHEATEHREAARAGGEQGLEGRGTGGGVGVVPADQEVGRDRREFPRDEQRGKVRCDHHADHRPGEDEQEPGEASERPIRRVVEVAPRVEQHERCDDGDDEHHHEREAVESNREIEV